MVRRRVGSFLIDDDVSANASKSVLIAESADDLRKIGELRYSLYVERDGKAYPCADRDHACLIEPIDHDSLNLFGLIQDSCVSTLRITRAHLAVEDEYLHRLLANSPFDSSSYDKVLVASRLASHPNADSHALMLSVIRESYRIALRNGIAFTVAATRTSLLPFFTRLGFVPSGQTYSETVAGKMNVVVLDMYDRRQLESVQSIFLDPLDEFESEKTAGACA